MNNTSELWKKAKPISEWYKKKRPWSEMKYVDSEMAAYGNWYLYVDADGEFYKEYTSIGD